MWNNPLSYTDPSGFKVEECTTVGYNGNCDGVEQEEIVVTGEKKRRSCGGGCGDQSRKSSETERDVQDYASRDQGGWVSNTQTALDVAGLTPGIGIAADFANVVLSLATGDFAGAGLTAVGMVPVVGQAATATKLAANAKKTKDALSASGDTVNRGAFGHKANTGLKKQLKSEEQLANINNGGGVPTHGAGAPRKLDVAGRLEKQYGGNSSDWQKVSSDAYKSTDGGHIEIHAYRNVSTGQVVEPKSIVNPQIKGSQ